MSRTGHSAYRRKRKQLQRNSDTCHLCGHWIDPDLKYPDPASFSADHIDPVSRGGHNLGAIKAAHLRCNQVRGAKTSIQTEGDHLREW